MDPDVPDLNLVARALFTMEDDVVLTMLSTLLQTRTDLLSRLAATIPGLSYSPLLADAGEGQLAGPTNKRGRQSQPAFATRHKVAPSENMLDLPQDMPDGFDLGTFTTLFTAFKNQLTGIDFYEEAESLPDQSTKKQKVKHGSGVKGKTDADRMAAKELYQMMRAERLDPGFGASPAQSDDWWCCQVCLVCLKEVSWQSYQENHKTSGQHCQAFKSLGGCQLKAGVTRPPPDLIEPLAPPNFQRFVACAGFASGSILSLGEQDYSFSLAIAKTQAAAGNSVSLVATSYLAEHDPAEVEEHVKDDGLRAHYSRKSLPSMEGMLQRNINEIRRLGGVCIHNVDATDLAKTLMPQIQTTYDVLVFPFPRASLVRGVDPRNPRLIRNFFRSVNETNVLQPGGKIALVLLRSQYPDWDIACAAMDEGYYLKDQATLPPGFYQSREMSGKPWVPKDAEVYVFQQGKAAPKRMPRLSVRQSTTTKSESSAPQQPRATSAPPQACAIGKTLEPQAKFTAKGLGRQGILPAGLVSS